ncbi:MAG: hypothetical protein QMD95_01155 [Candidatus Hodarchaeaceae archaeon]|nr:hypothetical protein [Candidatus Hodarchaeaceae archaeon]
MSRCSVCGREFPEGELVRCSECGRPYCRGCAGKDPSMRALGICSDCEEAHGAEEFLDEEL